MRRRAIVNRADLVRLLIDAVDADRNRLAWLCGFELRADKEMGSPVSPPERPTGIRPVEQPVAPPPRPPATKFTYLRATRFESLQAPAPKPPDRPFSVRDLAVDYGVRAPDATPLMPYARLLPYLRRAFDYTRAGNRPDEGRLLAAAVRLDPIRAIPRQHVPAWPSEIRIIADGRAVTSGFAEDVLALRRRLERMIGRDGCPVYYLFDGSPTPPVGGRAAELAGGTSVDRSGRIRIDRRSRAGAWSGSLPRAAPGVHDLVLSDLGLLDGDRGLIDVWRRYLRRQSTRLDAITLLMPCPRSRWDRAALGAARAVCWDRYEHLPASRRGRRASEPADPGATQAGVTALLNRIGPALHVEPGLLREARLVAGGELLDVGVEHDARHHPDVEQAGSTIAITPAKRGDYRKAFGDLPDRTRKAVAAIMRARHLGYSIAYRLEEALNLAEAGAPIDDFGTTPDGQPLDVKVAREARGRLLAALEQAVFEGDSAGLKEPLADWLARSVDRASEDARMLTEVAEAWVLAKFVETGDVPVDLPDVIDQQSAASMAARLAKLLRDDALETPIPLQVRQGVLTWSGAEREDITPFRARVHGIEVSPWSPVQGASGNEIFGMFPAAFLEGSRVTALEIDQPGDAYRSTHPLRASDVNVTVGLHMTRSLALETDTARVELAPWSIPTWASAAGCDEYGDYVEIEIGGVLFAFRWIPPGTFLMGSPEDEPGRWDDEGPVHAVTISRGFWLGSTPCTQAQWRAVMGGSPSGFQGEDIPVEQVSWNDCVDFCARLGSAAPGLRVRLPSEAEWEYACRSGTASAFNDGSACTEPEGADPALDRLAWYRQNSESRTHSVGLKAPNGWGLYDMHGNVLEWCFDAWSGSYGASDQIDPCHEDGADRVVRGGCWSNLARYCRAAYRDMYGPGDRYDDLGFRLLAGQEAEQEWQRRALGSAERVPRDEAPIGAPKATRRAGKKP